MPSISETMTVDLPEGKLDGVEIRRVAIDANALYNRLEALKYGRGTRSGTYTQLWVDGELWMSDTDAEKRDHLEAAWKIRERATERVLINGLGIGMVLKYALAQDHVKHVDVVEDNQRVIDLVGPHYADPRLTIHHADAYAKAKAWPTGTRWDVAWHDIWLEYNEDNLPKMTELHRSYGKRVGWQGSWSKDRLEHDRNRERREARRYDY